MFGIECRPYQIDETPFGPRGQQHLEAVRTGGGEAVAQDLSDAQPADPARMRQILHRQDVTTARDRMDSVDLSPEAQRALQN